MRVRELSREVAAAFRQLDFTRAEAAAAEAVPLARQAFGPRHPDTLSTINNLGVIYANQSRHAEAEPLLQEALEGRREILGPLDPETLRSANELGLLYRHLGRFGAAERLYRETLQARRQVLGPRDPETLTSLNNLALLYKLQGRFSEAEPLFREDLTLSREIRGSLHRDTLATLLNYAGLQAAMGRRREAEPMLLEALAGLRQVQGPGHPDTQSALNNLAELYRADGRFDEAEPLYRELLAGARKPRAADRARNLTAMNNLALLLAGRGAFKEAEPLLRQVLAEIPAVWGADHPNALTTRVSLAFSLAGLGQQDAAVTELAEAGDRLLSRMAVELYSSDEAAARRRLVAGQSDYQNITINIALLPGIGEPAAVLAATAVLRLKGIQAEEEAALAQLTRQGSDARVQDLARAIATLRRNLASLYNTDNRADVIQPIAAELQAKEFELGQLSRRYAEGLQSRNASIAEVQRRLPAGSALLDLREYRPVDWKTAQLGPARWAGILVAGTTLRVVDLGPMAATAALTEAILQQLDGVTGQTAADTLHAQLITPLTPQLIGVERLYISPDGILHLLPWAALRSAEGRRLAQAFTPVVLQTGRDLIRPAPASPAVGLVAMGGMDFASAASASPAQEPTRPAAPEDAASTALRQRTAGAFRNGFSALPGSAKEVNAIARTYREHRATEPVEVLVGPAATEASLLDLRRPPRALHLATHGFYLSIGTQKGPPIGVQKGPLWHAQNPPWSSVPEP